MNLLKTVVFRNTHIQFYGRPVRCGDLSLLVSIYWKGKSSKETSTNITYLRGSVSLVVEITRWNQQKVHTLLLPKKYYCKIHYEIFGIAKLLKAVQLTFLISTLIKLLRNYGFVVLKLSVIIMILFAIFIKFKL